MGPHVLKLPVDRLVQALPWGMKRQHYIFYDRYDYVILLWYDMHVPNQMTAVRSTNVFLQNT